MAVVRHIEFWKVKSDLYRHAILLPCAEFHGNRTIGWRVMAKKMIF